MSIHTTFQTLRDKYPNDLSHNELFDEIGWSDLKNDKKYENTCAIRMSYCFIRAGINIPGGRMPIKKGPHKGRMIEPGQVALSKALCSPHLLGKPIIFEPGFWKNSKEIKGQNGVISFMQIPGYAMPTGGLGGHIDLLYQSKLLWIFDTMGCVEGCYWNSAEVWFWPVK